MLNPVLRREARTSLRNWKTFIGISAYALFIAAITALVVYFTMFNSYSFGFDPREMLVMYGMLAGSQFGISLLVTPALCGGSISGERERQTLDILLISKMSAGAIVRGKLMSSLGVIFLMIISTLPVFAIMFFFGGVSIVSIITIIAFILSASIMAGGIAIFASALFKRTSIAVVFSYLILGIIGFGTIIAFAIFNAVYYNIYTTYPTLKWAIIFFAANPGMGFFSLIDSQFGLDALNYIPYYYSSSSMSAGLMNNFWIINMACNIIVGSIFTVIASLIMKRAPGRRTKSK